MAQGVGLSEPAWYRQLVESEANAIRRELPPYRSAKRPERTRPRQPELP